MKDYKFDAFEATKECVNWIKQYFAKNGNENAIAVIGISGGKDSAVAAALCVRALGKDKVIGVKMPQGVQSDIQYANDLIQLLDIKAIEVNIKETCETLYKAIRSVDFNPYDNKQVTSNLPARIRMTTLYAIAAEYHGRVVNTCNLSEDYVGYSTKFGDNAGDFSPLGQFTSEEVVMIGSALDLPKEIIEKAPEDGLSGLTDEENFGFSYLTLHEYIRMGKIPDIETLRNIEARNKRNQHKHLKSIPVFHSSRNALTSELIYF